MCIYFQNSVEMIIWNIKYLVFLLYLFFNLTDGKEKLWINLCANTYLYSELKGGGHTKGSSALFGDLGLRMSNSFSNLKLSSVPMMAFTCSHSAVSSCLTCS